MVKILRTEDKNFSYNFSELLKKRKFDNNKIDNDVKKILGRNQWLKF